MESKKNLIPSNSSNEAALNYRHELRTLYEWSAPGRPFKKRTKTYFATSLLILLFVEILLFLFGQYALMLVALSLVFVSFSLAIVPPHNFNYRISTEGIFLQDSFFIWRELYDFYFKKINGVDVLHVRTKAFMPGEITLTLKDASDENKIKDILLQYLPFREYIRPTFLDRSSTWLSKTFPLENMTSKV